MIEIRRIICSTVLLVACSCFNCIAEESEIQMYSPDGSLKLIAYESGNVYFKIYSANGRLEKSINTEASAFHRWSVSWYKDYKILLKSSDRGDYFFTKRGDEWIKTPANEVLSIDRKMIAEVTWAGGDKKVTLTIGEPYESYPKDLGLHVLYRIPTNIELDELVDVLSWDKDDLIELRAKDKKYYWQKQKDGTWRQVEKYEETTAKPESDKKAAPDDRAK
ncbi:MAG: hypothetical protein WC637_02150 [Victivallales bacterium]